MIVQTTQSLKLDEVIATLKSQFSDYGVYTFDSKPQKSIIVRKSAFIGAQITVNKDKIRVDACSPNFFVSGLIGFMSAIPLIHHRFEVMITEFLKKKYT